MDTIRVTLGVLVQAEPVLQKWAGLVWPPKTAHTVRKLTTLVATELEPWHSQRQAWIRELGQSRPDQPESYTVKPEHVSTFIARLSELAAVEVTILWRPLEFRELDQAEEASNGHRSPAKFAPADLMALGPLLGEPENGAS